MNLKNLVIGLVSSLGLGVAVGAASLTVNSYDVKETKAAGASLAAGTVIYLDTGGQNKGWYADNANVYAWTWYSTSSWEKPVYDSVSGMYKFTLASAANGITLLREDSSAPARSGTNWGSGNGWNKCDAEFVSGKNCLNCKSVGTFSSSSWSVYTAPINTTLEVNFSSAVPSYAKILIPGGFNSWSSTISNIEMTRVTDTKFTYNLTNVTPQTFEYKVVAVYSDASSLNYDHGIDTSNQSITLQSSNNNQTVTLGNTRSYNFATNMPEPVADGAYLRGDWTNGWETSGQRSATVITANTKYSIENVVLGDDGTVKMVIYTNHNLTWCQPNNVTSTDSTNYPVSKPSDGMGGYNVKVAKAGTYTITITKNNDKWDYEFEGTSNPNLEAADAFCAAFKTAMNLNCPATGTNKTTSDVKNAWENQASNYNDLDGAVKAYLLDNDTTDSHISEFQERYDSIFGAYGTSLSLSDFLGRHPSQLNMKNPLNAINDDTAAAAPIMIATTGVITLTAVGGYFFIKKKPF